MFRNIKGFKETNQTQKNFPLTKILYYRKNVNIKKVHIIGITATVMTGAIKVTL